jgi:hypothetical protein
VRRDGEVIGAPLFGVAVPVDPGPHEIAATATDRALFTTTIDVKADHPSETVTIPELGPPPPVPAAAAPAPATGGTAAAQASSAPTPSSPAPESHADGGTAQRRLAVIVGGVGVVALGASAVFAIEAKHRYNESLSNCRPDDANLCNQTGLSKREDARSSGNIASVTLGIGVLALGVAAFEWLTTPAAASPHADTRGSQVPAPAEPRFDLAGTIGPGGSSVAVRGVW